VEPCSSHIRPSRHFSLTLYSPHRTSWDAGFRSAGILPVFLCGVAFRQNAGGTPTLQMQRRVSLVEHHVNQHSCHGNVGSQRERPARDALMGREIGAQGAHERNNYQGDYDRCLDANRRLTWPQPGD
jgi:hypothetical protein